MANSFLKATVINRTALKLLEREVVLPKLVWNYPSADFVGAYNDTVTLRLPAVLSSREYNWRNDRSSDIVLDEVTEVAVPVLLNHDLYSAVAVTDEQLTLDIVDFSEQVLNPQVKAVARGMENLIASTMNAATYAHSINISDSANGMWGTLIQARQYLNDEFVPRDSRILLVGSDIETELLSDDKFNRVDSAGDGATSALREAIIQRLAGFTIVGSAAIDPEVAYAFHPTAFAFANIAPVVPDGVTSGSRIAAEGLALRWIKDYDAPKLRDRSVVSSFCGCTSVMDDGSENVRAVRINFQGAS